MSDNVPVTVRFGVYALRTCVYASGRACTCLYWHVSVCTPSVLVFTPLDIREQARTGTFLCLYPVHVCVRPWTSVHVPVAARLSVYPLCTCVFAPGRA